MSEWHSNTTKIATMHVLCMQPPLGRRHSPFTASALGRPCHAHRRSRRRDFAHGRVGCSNAPDSEGKGPINVEMAQEGSAQEGSDPDRLARPSSEGRKGRRRQADSTDWVASQLTRRFGIAGGLVWLGILAFGVISEQIKTRLEDSAERENTRDVAEEKFVTTASGLRYADKRIGGGAPVSKGLLLILDYRGLADGKVFEDTKERGKPIVFTYGARPFVAGLCQGVEEALSTMRAGGIRRVIVPPELGFGSKGAVLRPTVHVPEKQGSIPPGATLEYELSLQRVSIPPS